MATGIKRQKKPLFVEGLREALALVLAAREERQFPTFSELGIFRCIEERLVARIELGDRRS